MAIFPGAISTDTDLLVGANFKTALLTDNPLSAGAVTVNVNSTSGFPTVGALLIDSELIKYTGLTGTSFTGCTRGFDSTAGVSHVQNSQVRLVIIAFHHNGIKDEVKAIEQFISDLIGRTNTQVLTPDGTGALPSHSFASDPDSGLYRISSNRIALGVGGGAMIDISSVTGNIILSGTVLVPDGAATTPPITFSNDTNTGIYRNAADSMRLVAGGTVVATAFFSGTTAQLIVGSGSLTEPSLCIAGNASQGFYRDPGLDITASSVPLSVPNGTVSAPTYTFTGDENTGIYRVGSDSMGLAVGGTAAIILDGNALVEIQNGSVSTPALTFISDTNSGLYRIGADNIALGTNGIRAIEITSAQAVNIKGTATNNNAAAGDVGEYVESVQGTNQASPGNNQWFDITSISLTAGDWDVCMIAGCNSTNYTVVTDIEFGLGTVSGNTSPGNQMADWVSMSFASGHAGKINQTFCKRFSLSATTTVYAKALFTFSAGTQNGICKVFARRAR